MYKKIIRITISIIAAISLSVGVGIVKPSEKINALWLVVDALLVFIMAMLAIIVLIDMFYKFYRYLSGRVGSVEKQIDYRG